MAQEPVLEGNPADKTSLDLNFRNIQANFTEVYTAITTKLASLMSLLSELKIKGTAVPAAALQIDQLYEIASVEGTDFTGVGASANTVGVQFTASGPTTGDGTAIPIRLLVNDTINYTDIDDDLALWSVEKIGELLSYKQGLIGQVETAGVYFIEETLLGNQGIYSPGTWKLFYSDGTPGVKEFAIGSAGTFLKSNGTGGAPGWESPLTSENLRTLQAAAGNDFVAGSIGYLHTDGTIVLADASDANTCMQLLFMATDTIAGGAWGVFSRWGDVTVTAHGLGLGLPIFLSTTAGGMSTDSPLGGTVARIIGYAITTNVIDFRPDQTWAGIPA